MEQELNRFVQEVKSRQAILCGKSHEDNRSRIPLKGTEVAAQIAKTVYQKRKRGLIPSVAILPALLGLLSLSSGVGVMSRLSDTSLFEESIQKVSPSEGVVIWEKQIRPALGRDFHLTLDLSNTLKAKTSQGKTIWRHALPPISATSSPVAFIKNSQIYIALSTANGVVYLLDALTGKALWTQDLDTPIDVTPVLIQNSIFAIACTDGRIYGLDAANGSITYMLQTDEKITAFKPVLDNKEQTIYATNDDKRVLSLNALTGDLLWNRETSGTASDSPIITANKIITPTKDNDSAHLWAFENNGDLSWMTSFSPYSSFAANDNYLAVAEGTIVTLLPADNGEPIYYWQLAAPPKDLALVGGHSGALFVKTDQGDLTATLN
ncbi:MAG TPA: PQQ-binding-like beta-propeller repeat protein [Turneriella sp.]|nr:PQQ-binding-like beta-propeller repeat protein [Turneriella sp.]